MHAIAHRGLYGHSKRVSLKADSGRKIRCLKGYSNPCHYFAWLFSRTVYPLSYCPPPPPLPPIPAADFNCWHLYALKDWSNPQPQRTSRPTNMAIVPARTSRLRRTEQVTGILCVRKSPNYALHLVSLYHCRELPQVSFLQWQKFCCDKNVRQNTSFVATKVCLSRQKYACCDKHVFVATNTFCFFSRQT